MNSIKAQIVLSLITMFAAITANIIVPIDDHKQNDSYHPADYPGTYPFVVDIIRSDPYPYPPPTTSDSTVDFIVVFSEPVAGVDMTDFSLTTTGDITGASVSSVTDTGDHRVYIVTVDTGNGNGTIRLDLVDDNSIEDSTGNPLGGPGVGDGDFTSGEVYTINKSAEIDVYIAEELQESYQFLQGESRRENYAVNNGLVQVTSTNDIPIIAAMRTIWYEPGERTSYAEMMGLPKEQLSTEYWFPWYNNLSVNAMNQQIRFGVP